MTTGLCVLDPTRTRLTAVSDRFALPAGYRLTSARHDEVVVGTLTLYTTSLTAVDHTGDEVCVTVADGSDHPVERAWLQLLERVAVQVARAQLSLFNCYDVNHRRARRLDLDLVFPPAVGPRHLARETGVAVGPEWAKACEVALRGLVVSDRVLRSFAGGDAPVRVAPPDRVPEALLPVYQIDSYLIPPWEGADHLVAGTFLLPRSAAHPLVYGFGAGRNLGAARRRATAAAVGRLALLWGRPVPEREPEPSPSADYHQDFYLYPPHRRYLQAWLSGRLLRSRSQIGAAFDGRPVTFADLTPPELADRLVFVRAVSRKALTPRFGRSHRGVPHPVP